MITNRQAEFYDEHGFVVVEGVLSPAEVARLREVTEQMVEAARGLTSHNEVYDLEDVTRPTNPGCVGLSSPTSSIPSMRGW